MATAEHIAGSILTTVVEHERSLIAKLESAREDARAAVERAKAEARSIIQAEEAKLADETAAMRRAAESARNKAFEETVQAAKSDLVGVRQRAEGRVAAVAEKVLGLFVPKGAGESKS